MINIQESKTTTVIQLPEKFMEEWLARQARIEANQEEILRRLKLPTEDFITLEDFMAATGVKRTVAWKMVNGTHESGFHLRTEKRPGSNNKWVPKSELQRWIDHYRDQYPRLRRP